MRADTHRPDRHRPARRRGSGVARPVVLALVLVLLVAACGGSDFDGEAGGQAAGTEPGAGEAATEGASPGGGNADLQLAGFASSSAEDEQLRQILTAYEEETSNTVEFSPSPDYQTTLQAALAGGQPPDVFYVNDNMVPDLASGGALMAPDGRVDNADDFYPALVDAFTWEDTFYCPPKDFSTLALQYNVAMFDEAGVEPPTTWDELRSVAEQLTTGDQVGLVLGDEWFRWGVFALQAGASLTNDDVTEMSADTDAMTEAFEYIAELYASGVAASASDLDAGWPGEAFGQEKAAMTIEGNWIVPALTANYPDVEWAVAELPEGPAGPGTFTFSVCYAVAEAAADPQASWDLVNFLVGSDQMLEFTQQFPVMPSRQSLREPWLEAHPVLEPFLDSVEYAVAPTYVPGFQSVLDTLNAGIQGIAAGDRGVDEVLSEIQQVGSGVLGG